MVIGTWCQGEEVGISTGLGDCVAAIIGSAGNRDDNSGKNCTTRTINNVYRDGGQLFGVEVTLILGNGFEDVTFLLGKDVVS